MIDHDSDEAKEARRFIDSFSKEEMEKIKIHVDKYLSLPKKKRREYNRLIRHFGPYFSRKERMAAEEKAMDMVYPKVS